MMIPAARQRVLVKDRMGLYIVLNVNQESRQVDLVELESATVVEGVHFDNVIPLRPRYPVGNRATDAELARPSSGGDD